MADPGCVLNANWVAVAGLTVMDELVPVFEFGSVAVRVTSCATLSLVLMVNAPLDKVLVLSPKVLSPLPSSCALPLLVMVTTVLLSPGTAAFKMSWAVTVVVKAVPAVCGEEAVMA